MPQIKKTKKNKMNNRNGNITEDSLTACLADVISSLVKLEDIARLLKNAHTTDGSVHMSIAYNMYVDDKWDRLQDTINSIWVAVYDLEYIFKK